MYGQIVTRSKNKEYSSNCLDDIMAFMCYDGSVNYPKSQICFESSLTNLLQCAGLRIYLLMLQQAQCIWTLLERMTVWYLCRKLLILTSTFSSNRLLQDLTDYIRFWNACIVIHISLYAIHVQHTFMGSCKILWSLRPGVFDFHTMNTIYLFLFQWPVL